MARVAHIPRWKRVEARLPMQLGIALVCCAVAAASGAKRTAKTVTAPDGRPVRKVYIHADSAATANAASVQLSQDTCLTAVSDPKQADAVLELGIALPTVQGDEAGGPNVFGPHPHAQTLGSAHDSPKRSASATCSDGKGGKTGCSSTYSVQGGEAASQPASVWQGNAGSNYDVSLAAPGDEGQELWEPDARTKHSWSDQLRVAAGCPVCPGESFNPRRDKNYQQWMQAKCPGLLTGASQ